MAVNLLPLEVTSTSLEARGKFHRCKHKKGNTVVVPVHMANVEGVRNDYLV